MKAILNKSLFATGALLAGIALPAIASAERVEADLDSFQSVPAKAVPGSGQFTAKLKHNKGKIKYRLSYEDVTSPVTQVHIHFGNAWENGQVIAFLCTNLGNAPEGVPACPVNEGTVKGVIKAEDVKAADVIGAPVGSGIAQGDLDTLFDALNAGAVYVNVHTEAAPTGQLRGQID